MQTRKRAKSIMFGRKEKEKKEEQVDEPKKEKIVAAESEEHSEKVVEKAAEKTTEKAAVVERRVVPDKPQADELSSTLPHIEEETETDTNTEKEEIEAPHEEPVKEEPPAHHVSKEKDEEVEESGKSEELQENTPEAQPEPIETQVQAQETPAPVTTPAQSTSPEELSSTLPPSAFTIQEGDSPVESIPEEKKRVGVYFFVIAFLAFILGLGAMAAISYLGLINPNLSKLAGGVHIPALLGAAKPTPTSVPTPSPAPTAKPVNLQVYTIAVLNGSGVTGAAGKTQSSLNSAGFKVTSTGNADRSDYTKTEISAKKSVDPAYISKLEDELNKSFVIDTTVGISESSSTSDVTVIIGTQTAQ